MGDELDAATETLNVWVSIWDPWLEKEVSTRVKTTVKVRWSRPVEILKVFKPISLGPLDSGLIGPVIRFYDAEIAKVPLFEENLGLISVPKGRFLTWQPA